MSTKFLEIKNISKKFGNVIALDNVSLSISKSELFSLLGSSGCGKSTLLRIIAGFEKPDSGSIIMISHNNHLRPVIYLILVLNELSKTNLQQLIWLVQLYQFLHQKI